jgi:hypothetical protein
MTEVIWFRNDLWFELSSFSTSNIFQENVIDDVLSFSLMRFLLNATPWGLKAVETLSWTFFSCESLSFPIFLFVFIRGIHVCWILFGDFRPWIILVMSIFFSITLDQVLIVGRFGKQSASYLRRRKKSILRHS